MKILVVYKEDYPWDVRVEKIIDALAEEGHEVFILSNNSKGLPRKGYVGQHPIRRLPAMRWIPAQLAELLKLPLWFNPFWYFLFRSMVRKHRFDAVLIRDLPLLNLAVRNRKRYRFRVVFDMAEVYPEMYQSIRDFGKFNLKEFLLKSPGMAERYERKALAGVDHTFTMIEESRDRLLAKNVPSENVSIVSNTPPVKKYKGAVVEHVGQALRIVYVGRLTRLRGLDLLIEGVNEFLRHGGSREHVKLDIVGTGPVKEDLRNLVQKLGIQDCVTIHGWLDQQEVDDLMTSANVGVVTYRVCGHWNHTIPNKIFDYMLAGIPVLSTPVITIGRIIQQQDCGIVTTSEAPEELGTALKQLSDPELRQRLGDNGTRAVLERYNWEADKKTIFRVMQAFDPAVEGQL
jgi:glycosyltransferase involved in cell wall biosynthesis